MRDGGDWERGHPRRRGRPRLVVTVAAVAAVAAVGAVLWRVAGDEGPVLAVEDATAPPAVPDDPPVQLPGGVLPGRWDLVAPGPLSDRMFATMTWTGQHAVVWGGLGDGPLADGAAYEPGTDRWTPLPRSPLSPRFGHAAVWTGGEVVIAGGTTSRVAGGGHKAELLDAAAFDPRTWTWRTLPPLPFPTGAGHVFSAGGRLFAVSPEVRAISLLMLEPGRREWTNLVVPRPGGTRGETAGPIEAGLAHGELVLWSHAGSGAGAVLDLKRPQRWRALGRAEQMPPDFPDCCVLVASEASVRGTDVIAYDRAGDLWWGPVVGGLDAELATSDELLFLVGLDSLGGALDRRTGVPLRLPPAPLEPRLGAATVWTGDRLLVWGGSAADGVRSDQGAAFVPSVP